MVDEGVEELGTRGLGQVVAPAVVDVVERAVLVLEFEVVPVLATHEDTAVTVLELKVMHTLENLREGLAFLEVLTVVIGGAGGRLAAQAHGVGGVDEFRIRSAHGPAGADRQRRVELAFDFTDLEVDGIGTGAGAKANGKGQQVRSELFVQRGGGPLAMRACV
ncbi:hypothetical protein D9M71_625250 [compost metagenome]